MIFKTWHELTFIPHHAAGRVRKRDRNMFLGEKPQATISISKVPPKSSNFLGRCMRVRMGKME